MPSAESGKSRKPYKITKARERWSDEEHGKFREAIDRCLIWLSVSLNINNSSYIFVTGRRRFGRNWKEIVAFVGTRSVSQVTLPSKLKLSGCSIVIQSLETSTRINTGSQSCTKALHPA